MTIQQIVTIPADRRIYLDLPETAPVGSAEVTVTLKTSGKRPGILDWILHPVQSYRFAGWMKLLARLKTERERNGPLFGGVDGLEYQRNIRGEWENCF